MLSTLYNIKKKPFNINQNIPLYSRYQIAIRLYHRRIISPNETARFFRFTLRYAEIEATANTPGGGMHFGKCYLSGFKRSSV